MKRFGDLRGSDFDEIGVVFVDSGQIMIVDPCYVLRTGDEPADEQYDDVLDAYNPDMRDRETIVEPWGVGLGTVVSTFYGDGAYTVYARRIGESNAQILIDFEQLDD